MMLKLSTPNCIDSTEPYTQPSIFLAGPSHRDWDAYERDDHWRIEATYILEELGFPGTVFSPEPFTVALPDETDYELRKRQIAWEHQHLELATVVAFWVPRNMQTLPGLTTNIEFGEYLRSGKIILGYPPGAERMQYLDIRAQQHNVPIRHTLAETMKCAVEKTELYYQLCDEFP